MAGEYAHGEAVGAGCVDAVVDLERAVADVVHREMFRMADERTGRVDGAVQQLHRHLGGAQAAVAAGLMLELMRFTEVLRTSRTLRSGCRASGLAHLVCRVVWVCRVVLLVRCGRIRMCMVMWLGVLMVVG